MEWGGGGGRDTKQSPGLRLSKRTHHLPTKAAKVNEAPSCSCMSDAGGKWGGEGGGGAVVVVREGNRGGGSTRWAGLAAWGWIAREGCGSLRSKTCM